MDIHLNHLTATNLGPIQRIDEPLSRMNLIYSGNEGGKTMLTAFLMQCLFKQQQKETLGSGKVWVSGLGEEQQAFSPASRYKLDHYLVDQKGLPASLRQLLVVKGSDFPIASAEGGIDQATLRDLLSDKRLLDTILDQIPKTAQNARIQEGGIQVDKKGPGKTLHKLQNQLQSIEATIDNINQNYATGYIQDLKNRQIRIQAALEEQKLAKQYLAYQTQDALKATLSELDHYDASRLTNLYRDIEDYEAKQEELKSYRGAEQNASEANELYQWLVSAKNQYKSLIQNAHDSPQNGWLVAGLLGFTGALAAMVFDANNLGIVFLILVAGALSIYTWQDWRGRQKQGETQELANLKQEFQNKTGKALHTEADIDTVLAEYSEAPSRVTMLREKIDELKQAVNHRYQQIQQTFITLDGNHLEPSEWRSKWEVINNHVQSLNKQAEQLREKLTSLGIDESDYNTQPQEVNYSQATFDQLQSDLATVQNNITEAENALTELKSTIGSLVGESVVGLSFNAAYEKLLTKRDAVESALKEQKAGLAADNIVTELIGDLKAADDQTIAKAIGSDQIQKPLHALTGHYDQLILTENGRIQINSDTADHDLANLSTGTREQVMLALRAGIGAKLLQSDNLFLWLDDAFQHSDWSRRPQIIEYLANFALEGWQVIYLTMDDHIRDLFDEIGKAKLGSQYKQIDLAAR